MNRPQQLALVRPRIAPEVLGGAPLLLEERIAELLALRTHAEVSISAPPGAGYSTAIGQLAARFADEARLVLIDREGACVFGERDVTSVVVAPEPLLVAPTHAWKFAPWGEDECIEYLLQVHRERCASVMKRLRTAGDLATLGGRAELCRIVLDRMASDENVPSAPAALAAHVDGLPIDPTLRARIEDACLLRECASFSAATRSSALEVLAEHARAHRELRHERVLQRFAARGLARELERGGAIVEELEVFPSNLRQQAARLCSASPELVASLVAHLGDGTPRNRGAVASLLHAIAPLELTRWLLAQSAVTSTPVELHGSPSVVTRSRAQFVGARLDHVNWSGLSLVGASLSSSSFRDAQLSGTDLTGSSLLNSVLSRADLTHAQLDHVHLEHAVLESSKLEGSCGSQMQAQGASLMDADASDARLDTSSFSGADVRRARFQRASLQLCDFRDAQLEGTDFSGATLAAANLNRCDLRSSTFVGTTLRGTHLRGARLEGVDLCGDDLSRAQLGSARLTGAMLRDAKLVGAVLSNAELADIDAENADLRDADLRGARFHFGSTRSGLVLDAPPLEGTRTGFYTDEYFDEVHREPEDVRHANLRGADLRGAKVLETDFYLVDLRGALYDEVQAAHFRACRAILTDRGR